jgi:thiol-disulfide isomerase/thioredoxin
MVPITKFSLKGNAMKCLKISALLLIISVAFAQDETSRISIYPIEPKIGEKITISYTISGENEVLKNSLEIISEVLIDRDSLDPLLLEIPLIQSNDCWSCSFLLNEEKARLILIRFRSGEQKDDNDGKSWTKIIFDANGKPVEGAHLALGYFYLNNGRAIGFKYPIDISKAKVEFEKEKELYPNSWKATLALMDIVWKEKPSKENLGKELNNYYQQYKNDDDKLASVIYWYERIGDSAKAISISDEAIARNPSGKIAQLKASKEISRETDNLKRIGRFEKFLNDFTTLDNRTRQSFLQNLFYLYIRVKNYDKAKEVISEYNKPDGQMYNAIAWALIEEGDQVEQGIELAEKGIEITKNIKQADKPTYQPVKDWMENNKYTSAMLFDTYGFGLLMLGKVGEALANLSEAFDLSEGSDNDINMHYLDALIKDLKYDKAIDVGLSCVKKGKDSPNLIAVLKEAYSKKIGSQKEYDALKPEEQKIFDEMLAESKAVKIESLRKKIIESRINSPSFDFTLNELNGSPFTLSSSKGKVVILDFWATWCGPCKQSFPYLQKVYEKYQNNERVKFLAINTWERQKDYTSQVANAQKFVQDNKYTFPVLIDEKIDDQYVVISKYGVDGIPTKFILDKKGNIGFKSVGFDGPGMEDELTEQIEILLSE